MGTIYNHIAISFYTRAATSKTRFLISHCYALVRSTVPIYIHGLISPFRLSRDLQLIRTKGFINRFYLILRNSKIHFQIFSPKHLNTALVNLTHYTQ